MRMPPALSASGASVFGGWWSGAAEVLGPVGGAVGFAGDADADGLGGAVEQVGAVDGAVHPGGDDGGGGGVAPGDVLGGRGPVVGGVFAGDEGAAVGAGVGEEVLGDHVGAVFAGGGAQAFVGAQGAAAGGGAFGVHQAGDLVFDGGVRGGPGDGCRGGCCGRDGDGGGCAERGGEQGDGGGSAANRTGHGWGPSRGGMAGRGSRVASFARHPVDRSGRQRPERGTRPATRPP